MMKYIFIGVALVVIVWQPVFVGLMIAVTLTVLSPFILILFGLFAFMGMASILKRLRREDEKR